MNLLDVNLNFHDFITDDKWNTNDLKYLKEILKEIDDENLKHFYNELHVDEKNISKHNIELMKEIKKN